MADELLDLVDKDDNVIGTVWKSIAHVNPKLIHREVGIAVFNTKGQVLLQQRSFIKKTGPGEWKVTAAGHPNAHEDPLVATKRELKEELGFEVEPILYKKVLSTYSKNGKDLETRFTWLYYAVLDKTPSVKLQKSEVNAVKWIEIKGLTDFSKENDYDLNSLSHKTIIEIAKMLKLI